MSVTPGAKRTTDIPARNTPPTTTRPRGFGSAGTTTQTGTSTTSTDRGLWVYFPRLQGDTYFVPLNDLETFLAVFPGPLPDGYEDFLREQVPLVEPPDLAVLVIENGRHKFFSVPPGYPFTDL